MGPIKFRAWDKIREIMAPGGTSECPSHLIAKFMADHIFQQFTGLLDKNGVEIYEGDIIVRHGEYSEGERGFVEYEGCSFSLNRQDYIKDHHGAQWLDCPEEAFENNENQWCEVIGNIYENPELLESE